MGSSGIPLLMWVASGNYGNGWRYDNVVLSNPHSFRVSVQAEVGGNNWTDIAIDDLSFTRECAIGGTAASPSTLSFLFCNYFSMNCIFIIIFPIYKCINIVLYSIAYGLRVKK